jgi:hypothetical protein
MPYVHAEQPLSRSALKDTGGPDGDHDSRVASGYLFIFLQPAEPQGHVAASELPRAWRGSPSHGDTWRPQSCPELGAGARAVGTRGDLGAAPSWEWEPVPWGHMAAPELPRAGSESLSHGDKWHPRSYPQSGSGSHCLNLKLVRGGTQSSGYRQWPPGPPRERMRTYGWSQHPFPAQPF